MARRRRRDHDIGWFTLEALVDLGVVGVVIAVPIACLALGASAASWLTRMVGARRGD